MKHHQERSFKPRLATLLSVGIVIVLVSIGILWLTGSTTVNNFFTYLNLLQEQPPLWLTAPIVMGRFLLLPTMGILLLVLVITRVSPEPQKWSRFIVVAILLILTIRYVQWRSLATLNLSSPVEGIFSIALFLLEILVLFNSSLQLFLMVQVKDEQRLRNQLAVPVEEGTFQPTVDIFIPTYDEPEFILRRTIIGCQGIDYEFKTVYILDDTRREAIAKLAQELGCQYITRLKNTHAKAGNINNALPQTEGEFIAVFDADFVPSRNFLHRTLGFFQDEHIGLVQTPQNFYNIDPIARNLGLEDVLTPEEEVFYRQLQPIKNAAGSVVCAGTSFVVRRQALEAIGGFVTESISEDFFTGIRLSARGYRLVYIDEKLSAGLAAENIADHVKQRLRWARGTLQAFFINSNPLTIPGLSLMQRLAHLEGLLHWFSSVASAFFLLMPLGYAFFHIIPIRASNDEFLFFFLPYYLTRLTVFSWLNYRSRSAILSSVYGLVLAFPQAITVIQVMLNPFSKGFEVTPKGTKRDRFSFNWKLASPLIVLLILTSLSLWFNLTASIATAIDHTPGISEQMRGLGLGWIWSIYNFLTLSAALLILLDIPKPNSFEWFQLHRTIKLNMADHGLDFWGSSQCISEVGAEITFSQAAIQSLLSQLPITVEIEIMEENIHLTGQIISGRVQNGLCQVRVNFHPKSLVQERKLIALLYCRPGQWQRRNSPGELFSLWLLIKILLRPKIIFDRNPKVNAIKVVQTSI